jgi:uncharacterized repeat protein (TIGR01451 family)
MGSNIDPNSDFLTNRPSDFLEPLDPSILTQPAWINVFLTPGAAFETSIPVTSLPTNTPLETNTIPPIIINSPTRIIPSPTNTLPYFPPFTNTPKPPPLTNTPVTPSPTLYADLSITKSDGVSTYTPGGTLIYTITVTNNGPNNVIGAIMTDNKPTNITTWSWACTSQSGGASGCDPVAINGTNFNDTVNLPNGASIVYTVTANVSASATGNVTNTAAVNVPASVGDPNVANNAATDTDTIIVTPSVDLQIIKSDGGLMVYKANDVIVYTVTVSNNGPVNVVGATVNDNLPAQVASWNWACTTVTSASGCDAVTGSISNFTDTVNIQNGGSIVYTVTANISSTPSGSLVNTATVTEPVGIIDSVPGNNSATDTNQLSVTSYGNIGPGQDNSITGLNTGDSIILNLFPSITLGSHSGVDIIYYEQDIDISGGARGIEMDWVILEIGDGFNWYTVLNWGDGLANPGTNINIPLPPSPLTNPSTCILENDNCNIDGTLLVGVPGTGITIDIDLIPSVPPGTYQYIRITVPLGGADGGVGIDGIYVVP